MVGVVALFNGRGQQVVLGIVVDHGLGESLILIASLVAGEIPVHEGGYLLGIKLDLGNLVGSYISLLYPFSYLPFYLFFVYVHKTLECFLSLNCIIPMIIYNGD